MSVSDLLKKPAQADWHRADVVAALHKRGWSLRELSRQNELSPGTLKSALDAPYPKAERIIAQALEMKPEEIWPERYAKRNFTPVLARSATLSTSGHTPLNAAALG